MSTVRSTDQSVFGQPNKFLGAVRVDHVLVRYTDGDGREQLALAATFGKNATTGMPNVVIIAEQPQLVELREAKEFIRNGVIEYLNKDTAVSGDSIPEEIMAPAISPKTQRVGTSPARK